jgi:hypothetical protein
MLTDPVTSSFVPIGLQSPHPSQSACSDEQSEQEKNLGFPLAHGRIYTTAPLGSAFKQFSREGNLNGNSPVILKVNHHLISKIPSHNWKQHHTFGKIGSLATKYRKLCEIQAF